MQSHTTKTLSPLITEKDKKQKRLEIIYNDWPDCGSNYTTSSNPTATASITLTPPPSSPTFSTKKSPTPESQSVKRQEPQTQSDFSFCKEAPKNSRKRPLRKTQFRPFSEFDSQTTSSHTVTPPPQSQSIIKFPAQSEAVSCEVPPTKSRKCPQPKTQIRSNSELDGEPSSPSLPESQVDAMPLDETSKGYHETKGQGKGRGRGRG